MGRRRGERRREGEDRIALLKVLLLVFTSLLFPARSNEYELGGAAQTTCSGEGCDAAERPMIALVCNYLTTGQPDEALFALLSEEFNVQILFEEELRHGATLYDNLVSLGPSAVLQVVFAAPSDADEERDCGLQRALDQLHVPLISVCLEVPPAMLAAQGTGACDPAWLDPDVVLLNARFSTLVEIWERRSVAWHYDTAALAPSTGEDTQMSVYKAVAALIHVAVLNLKIEADALKLPTPAMPSQRHIALYLAARSAGLCMAVRPVGACSHSQSTTLIITSNFTGIHQQRSSQY